MLPKKLAFVDIETTGTSVTSDRIIEIGIIRVEDDAIVETFQSLIDPQTYVSPFIQNYTGITRDELDKAPTFASLQDEIQRLLSDCVFVAHNVRFDYGFVKNEFSRQGETYTAKQFCTVKLSRQLFPQHKRHNLTSIIERFNINCPNRHRALDDARVVLDFYQHVQNSFPEEKITASFKRVLSQPSVPAALKRKNISNLPEQPGVYIFYGQNGYPLYVGKSINIRERVLSHFSNDYTSSKEMHIAQQIESIETIVTAGELGALLKEAQLVKEMQPLYNRKLRYARSVTILRRATTDAGYDTVAIDTVDTIEAAEADQILGVCKSAKQAKEHLTEIAKSSQLCHKLLELEKSTGSCFPYQLGWCKGACIGKEPALTYNLRFALAFSGTSLKPWPFRGPIMIREYNATIDQMEAFLVNKWCLLGYGSDHVDLEDCDSLQSTFDLDTYKILVRYIVSPEKQNNISVLPAEFH
jgi:DNA polymerase-3 subunit epsilon